MLYYLHVEIIIMELTMSEKIKILAKRSNIALFQVAERSGQTRQNLANKLSRNDFKISELKRIADALGVGLEVNFVLPSGERV